MHEKHVATSREAEAPVLWSGITHHQDCGEAAEAPEKCQFVCGLLWWHRWCSLQVPDVCALDCAQHWLRKHRPRSVWRLEAKEAHHLHCCT